MLTKIKAFSGSASFSAAVLFRAVFQWVVVLVLARVGGAEQLGVYMTLLAIASPITLLFELGYRNIYAAQESVPPVAIAFWSRGGLLVVSSCAIVTVGTVGFGVSIAALLAICFYKAAESLLDLTFLVDQRYGDMIAPAKAILITSCTGSLLFASSALVGLSLELSILLLGAPAGVFAASAIPSLRRKVSARTDLLVGGRGFFWLLRSGVPTGSAQALSSLGAYLPVYYLTAHGQLETVGHYSVLAYFLTVTQLVMSSFQQVRLSAARLSNGTVNSIFVRALTENLAIAAPLSAGSLVAIMFALGPVYGAEFQTDWTAAVIVPMVILVYSGNYATATIMLITGSFWLQLFATLTATVAGGAFVVVVDTDQYLASALLAVAIVAVVRWLIGMLVLMKPVGS